MYKTHLVLLTLLVTSCTVGPDYVRPVAPITPQFKEQQGRAFVKAQDWKIAHPYDSVDKGEWWTLFHDARLNELENQLNHCNQNIANAVANYYQACALVDEARAGFFPTLAGILTISRQKQGGGSSSFINSSPTSDQTTVGTVPGTGIGGSRIRNIYSAFLEANWEPDIWGLVRRTVEANTAGAQANKALLASTRLSAQGSLAQFYFELRTLDRDQQLLNNTVKDYQQALKLTRNQYTSGVVSRADILQAQTQLQSAQAQAINNGILRSQYEHAIAVLIGRPPAAFSLPFMPLNAHVPVIPVTIPSVWLERRPDIAQAERLMQQTNAQIGIAVAAYYPVLNLSASVTATASNLSKLVSAPTLGWAYGLQLANTFFDGGLRSATVRAAQAGYMAQVASYRQTVLTAFQDVEDNLVALRLLKEQGLVQNQAAASAQQALQLITNQYKAGTVPYSNVITAQITAYTAQKNSYDVVGLQMTAAVGLIKALGGSWKNNCAAKICLAT